MEQSGDRLVRAVRRPVVSRSHESIRARVLFLSAKTRTGMMVIYWVAGFGVNRLKRGGCLFEGIALRPLVD